MFFTQIQFIKKAFVFILSIAMLSACSVITEFRSDMADKIFGEEKPDAPSPLNEIKPIYNAKIDWKIDLGETSSYENIPVLSAGILYTNNAIGDVIKINAEQGKEMWRVNIGEAISGGTEFAGGLVLVGTKRGTVVALDVNGKQLWKSFLSSEILSAPKYYEGLVIVRTNDNHIYGLDAVDGSRKWIYERGVPALTLRSSNGIVIDGGAVYAGFAGGKFVAIRADNGKLIWESTIAIPKGTTEIERITDITSLPFVDGPLVYTVAYQGKIQALDRKSGRPVWDRDISSYNGLTADSGKVFVTHTIGSVYALDYQTGRSFWRQADLINRKLTKPLSIGTTLAVGDIEGYIHFLSREEGAIVGRIKLDDTPVISLINGNNSSQLIAETRSGELYAVTVK